MQRELLPQRLTDLGFVGHTADEVEYVTPPLCAVPAGPFLMGSDPARDIEANDAEQPQHTVTLPAYHIARYPVSVAEYACGDARRANTSDGGPMTATPVGSYPTGASPCGAQDLAGNVWEWTSSLYKPYNYVVSDGRERPDSPDYRVLRGGSWNYRAQGARAARRGNSDPSFVRGSFGFRLMLP
jgi:formylglycine-generating enzyme required for sulfatase activity